MLEGRKATHPTPPGAPRPAPGEPEALEHEGTRSIAELGALLGHAGRGAEDAPELVQWVTPPHTDPIIALALTRRRLAECAAPDPFGRTCALPGERVSTIEIERAKGDCALAPAGLGTPSVRPVEPGWGGAPEPALHGLLRDWVGEVHERDAPDGAQSPPR